MTSRAPLRAASSGKPAAGYTTSDEPTAMNRSDASVSSSARIIAAGGIDWPNEIVAVLTNPPHDTQHGASPVRSNSTLDIRQLVALRAVQAMRIGGVAVQLDHPVRRHARRLMQPVDILRDHRRCLAAVDQRRHRAMAAIGFRLAHRLVGREPPPPGLAPRLRRRRRKSEKSIGRIFVQMPPGLRKSGMPDSVLIPAPVKTTIRVASSIIRRSSAIPASMFPPRTQSPDMVAPSRRTATIARCAAIAARGGRMHRSGAMSAALWRETSFARNRRGAPSRRAPGLADRQRGFLAPVVRRARRVHGALGGDRRGRRVRLPATPDRHSSWR